MHLFIRISTVLALLATYVLATPPVQLYAHSLETHEIGINLGVLTFNETSGISEIIDTPEQLDFEEGDYCIGAEINGNFLCHSYIHVSSAND